MTRKSYTHHHRPSRLVVLGSQASQSQACDWDCAGDLWLVFHDISILAHITEISSLYFFNFTGTFICLTLLQILSFLAELCYCAFEIVGNTTYIFIHIQSWTGFLTSVVFCYFSPLWSLLLLESRTLRSFCHFLFFHFHHWGRRRLWWYHANLFLMPFILLLCLMNLLR